MTYNVFGGMLSLTQSINQSKAVLTVCGFISYCLFYCLYFSRCSAVLYLERSVGLTKLHNCLLGLKLGMDEYLLQLSGSGRISTIWQNPPPARLHVSHRIGWMLITRDLVSIFLKLDLPL